MGAWIAQAGAEGYYWLQDANIGSSGLQYAEKPCKNRCRLDSGRLSSVKEEEEEESRRRMVELMLGPCKYLYNNTQQRLQHGEEAARLPTLDLLNAAPVSSLLTNYSFSAPVSFMDSTTIELEPDSPLPSGWEKCLDLKTGSIYYFNRSTGLNSSVDPRKAPVYDGKSGRGADLNSWPTSPATSEVTMEASLKSNSKQVSLNMNEKIGEDEGALDLNLSLHVGQSPSKLPPLNVNEAGNTCSVAHHAQFKAPSSVPSASSSSSSISSFPTNSSFPFPHSSMSNKECRPCPSQDMDSIINMQDTNNFSWLAPKESMYMRSDHPLSEPSPHSTEVTEHNLHGACNAPMVTVACANCLMFVMLSRSNPKCPRCGTCPDHLDFPQPPLKRAKLEFSFQ